jgi:hypothetical protein
LSVLVLIAHAILLSPAGYRNPRQIHRIIREKSRVQGPIGNIVEWQSLRTQEYRYRLLIAVARFAELFGVRRPMRFEPPIAAGDYDESIHSESSDISSILEQYLDDEKEEPHLGGKPKETGSGEEEIPKP